MLCYVMYEKWVQPMSQPKFWVYGPVTHVETPLVSHNAIYRVPFLFQQPWYLTVYLWVCSIIVAVCRLASQLWPTQKIALHSMMFL